MAPRPDRPREGPKEKPKPKELQFLKERAEKPLSVEIQELLKFFDEEEKRLEAKIFELREKYRPGDNAVETQINKNELRLLDLIGFRKLLYQHAGNPNVKEVAAKMNEVYEAMFGEPFPSEFNDRPFLERAREFVIRGDLHTAYVTRNELLDDTLDATQTERLIHLSATGHPDALFESYVTSIDRYEELLDKILRLPKQERDKNIDVLIQNLSFYKRLLSPEFHQHVEAEIKKAAKDVIEKQETRFRGLRGLIQRGVEKGSDFAIDHFSAIFGDEDSIARNLFIKMVKAGRDLSKPVTYDQKLVDELAKETIEQIQAIAEVIDKEKIEETMKACIELRANPDHLLSEENQETFQESFKEFLPVSVAFIEKIIATQADLLRDAYILSHGKESSFETDSTLRAKFLSSKGRDLIRLLQIYAPFGVFLPAQVERKEGYPPVHLRSAYHQGWFRNHPFLSTGLQAVEMTGLLTLAYGGAKFLGRITLAGRVIRSFLNTTRITKLVPYAFQIYLGYEIGTELNKYRISAQEREIFEILNEFNSFREIPTDVREKIRQLTLRNEIEKKRELFQGVGVDLDQLGVDVWHRLALGNVLEVEMLGETMKETGTFREAVLAANRKLVLLGFEPYEIR